MNRVYKKIAVLGSIAAVGLLICSSPGLAQKSTFSSSSASPESINVKTQKQPDEIETVEAGDFVELAELALGDRDYYNAIYHADKALDLNSNLPEMYVLRGRARKMLGQFQGAIEDLQEAALLYEEQNDREGEAIARELLLALQ